MMDLKETLSVSIDALRANKLRATLTSLGVIIGSASIVLVVTVALTSRKFVISKIEAVGSNVVWAELIRTLGKGAAAELRTDAGRHAGREGRRFPELRKWRERATYKRPWWQRVW